jgi:hypothetical protein
MKKVARKWSDMNDEYSEAFDKEIYHTINIEEILGHSIEASKDLDAMLTGVMKHLHDTGADTFEILRDDKLAAWWGKKLKEIKKQEQLAIAREAAKSTLTKEQRKLLGLDF